MNKHNGKRTSGRKGVMGTFMVLLLIGAACVVLPVIMQDMELVQDAAEYQELREQTAVSTPVAQATDVPVVNIDIPVEKDEPMNPQTDTEQPVEAAPLATETPTAESSAVPSQMQQERTSPDLAALKEQNGDFVAWIQIPGTNVDYPVVLTDDTEYYLTHTFSGKESKIGTLFSLAKTDYQTPGRNIAIYGHNIKSSSNSMFRTLHTYKERDFYADHATICFDTIYRSGTYTIFAVLNMIDGDWDPSTSVFVDDDAFMNFVENARAQAMYDTGVAVTEKDEILTLITCDRSYSSPDGRLIVMAVRA